jgi:hypothetical protein
LFDLEDAERDIDFNATRPCEDRTRYGSRIVRDTAGVAAAMGTVDDPQAHAERLRDILFPDLLRYRVGTDAHFGIDERNGCSNQPPRRCSNSSSVGRSGWGWTGPSRRRAPSSRTCRRRWRGRPAGTAAADDDAVGRRRSPRRRRPGTPPAEHQCSFPGLNDPRAPRVPWNAARMIT